MDADLTEGQRIYTVGDIHGRLDLLTEMLARIRRDIAARPHLRPRLVFLGDYMDRGSESRRVLETLIALGAADPTATFLLGNHDSYVAEYIREPDWYDRTYHWLHPSMGGNATLAAYGVEDADHTQAAATHTAFAAAFPAEHMAFLDAARLQHRVGGYLFVHAGIRPGVPFEEQVRDDLIWIREGFLDSTADLGAKVVHGHTIVPAVEHRRNRIAIDTGAFRTGILSCLVLEGDSVALLEPDGQLRDWPDGAGLPGWRNLWIRR